MKNYFILLLVLSSALFQPSTLSASTEESSTEEVSTAPPLPRYAEVFKFTFDPDKTEISYDDTVLSGQGINYSAVAMVYLKNKGLDPKNSLDYFWSLIDNEDYYKAANDEFYKNEATPIVLKEFNEYLKSPQDSFVVSWAQYLEPYDFKKKSYPINSFFDYFTKNILSNGVSINGKIDEKIPKSFSLSNKQKFPAELKMDEATAKLWTEKIAANGRSVQVYGVLKLKGFSTKTEKQMVSPGSYLYKTKPVYKNVQVNYAEVALTSLSFYVAVEGKYERFAKLDLK